MKFADRPIKLEALARMSLVERLTELRRHLEHLREIQPRVTGTEVLRRDLSLHNDVLFSLLTICQRVIDIAGQLSCQRGLRFGDYIEAVRNLESYPEFPADLVHDLEGLPGFRNVLIYEYVSLDLKRVLGALQHLQAVERFAEIVRRLEAEGR